MKLSGKYTKAKCDGSKETSKKCKKLKTKNNKKCRVSKVGGCESYPYSFSPTAAVQGAGATDGGVAQFSQLDPVSQGSGGPSATLLGALVATIVAAFLVAAVAMVVVCQVCSRRPSREMSRLTRKLNCAEVGGHMFEPAQKR